MLGIERIETELFDANCYVVTAPDSDLALVVDPGVGAAAAVAEALERDGKSVGAVLATHGHPDHVWDSAAVAAMGGGAPVYITGPDRYWLSDPMGLLAMGELPLRWTQPDDVREIPVSDWSPLPGMTLRMVPAPGHSPGSAIFLFAEPTFGEHGQAPLSALSGDVIFKGSIGRTDLPGGDPEVMAETLKTLKYSLDPATVLLPGHGPGTVWEEELLLNPHLPK